MRDLRTTPLWHPDDLGAPIPDVRHACSVCFPTWQSVIDYEEGREKVIRKLESGYPRFVLHPDVSALFSKLRGEYATAEQAVMVFPTRAAAQRAQRYLELQDTKALEIKSYKEVFVLIYPATSEQQARHYWRYTGEGVSSRQAQRILEGGECPESTVNCRQAIADLFGSEIQELHLWASGMTAIFQTHRHITSARKGKKTLQVDFPYVDAMRVQQSFGTGVVFLAEAKGEDLRIAIGRIKDREFSAVYVEMPSNPLLRTANIIEISKACRTSQTPLIIDDTVGSHYNIDVLPYADIVTTSLTKWISGKGDVMAGATRINPESPFAEEFANYFDDQNETGSLLDPADEEVLVENIKGFRERMEQINIAGEIIAEYLKEHEKVKRVYYPKFNRNKYYENLMTPHGGYGGLLSIELKQAKKTPVFYDTLKLNKGPSLGADFTLVCPYTMLAHYDELDWAETHKVSKNLIRFAIGTEPVDHLLAVIKESLASI